MVRNRWLLQRVWGTSSPMAPADVERRALTSLRELLKQVWAISTYPSLYLSTTACLCVLGWSPVSFWWKQNSKIQDKSVSCPCFWNAYHHHCPGQKSVQAKGHCSSFEEGTWWKKKLKLFINIKCDWSTCRIQQRFLLKEDLYARRGVVCQHGWDEGKNGIVIIINQGAGVILPHLMTNCDKFSDYNWENFLSAFNYLCDVRRILHKPITWRWMFGLLGFLKRMIKSFLTILSDPTSTITL